MDIVAFCSFLANQRAHFYPDLPDAPRLERRGAHRPRTE